MQLDKNKIETRMKLAGIETMGELADRVDVSRETLSRYISGTYNPSWEKLSALCVVLECKVDDIVTYTLPKALAPAV